MQYEDGEVIDLDDVFSLLYPNMTPEEIADELESIE